MKKLLLLISNLFIVVMVLAQPPVASITFHIKKANSGIVKIAPAYNNMAYFNRSNDFAINKDGNCVVKFNETQTGYIYIYFPEFRKWTWVYLQTGDKVIIDVDTASKSPFTFMGSNAIGNTLLTDKTIPFFLYDKYELLSVFKKDSTAKLLSSHIDQVKSEKKALFEKLYREKTVNKQFYEFVCKHLDLLYATVAVNIIGSKFSMVILARNDPVYLNKFPKEYRDYWDSILTTYPVNNMASMTDPGFNDYVQNYFGAYIWYKRWKAGDTSSIITDEFIKRKEFNEIKNTYDKKMAEDILASHLSFAFFKAGFEPVLIELFDEFKKEYPQSRHLSFIEPFYQKVVEFHSNKDFAKDQIILSGYSTINTFASLKEKLKGKMFFMDMWATWCQPCKEEFKYKDDLTSFLTANGIDMVYISLDEENKEKEWENMIKVFKLSGHHLRANSLLLQDLKNIFWDGKGYSIPRYVLVDETGTILEKKALAPKDKNKLYEQISSHLKK